MSSEMIWVRCAVRTDRQKARLYLANAPKAQTMGSDRGCDEL
jgi:hypothetical protein